MKVEAAGCSMVEHGLILINSSQHTLEVKKIQRNKQFSAQDAWYGFWSKLEIGHCRWILYCLSYQERPWTGYPIPSPGDLPDPGIKLGSPALQADSLPAELPGKPYIYKDVTKFSIQTGFLLQGFTRFRGKVTASLMTCLRHPRGFVMFLRHSSRTASNKK